MWIPFVVYYLKNRIGMNCVKHKFHPDFYNTLGD